MASNLRFMVGCLSVALACAGTARASADEPQRSAQPGGSGSQSFVQLSGAIAWDTIVWIERRYKIEALRFKARDESGIDWWGSDEVKVGTFDARGSTVSSEIGNIDSGDTHQFDPAKSCIIAVQPGNVVLGETSVCESVGEPAPLSFRVELWENDDGGLFVDFEPGTLPPEPGRHGSGVTLHSDEDDLLGRAQIDLSALDLESGMPNVGDVYDETVELFPCLSELCAIGPLTPDYTFTYRITRLPDVQVDLRSVVNEAMHRSGAGSELEAIVAGLRALRATSPRPVDSGTGKSRTTQIKAR